MLPRQPKVVKVWLHHSIPISFFKDPIIFSNTLKTTPTKRVAASLSVTSDLPLSFSCLWFQSQSSTATPVSKNGTIVSFPIFFFSRIILLVWRHALSFPIGCFICNINIFWQFSSKYNDDFYDLSYYTKDFTDLWLSQPFLMKFRNSMNLAGHFETWIIFCTKKAS